MTDILLIVIFTTIITTVLLDMCVEQFRTWIDRLPRAITDMCLDLVPDEVRDDVRDEWHQDLNAVLSTTYGLPITRLIRGHNAALLHLLAVNDLRARAGLPCAQLFIQARRTMGASVGGSGAILLGLLAYAAITGPPVHPIVWLYYVSQGIFLVALGVLSIRRLRIASAAAWIASSGMVFVWYAGCCENHPVVQVAGAAIAGVTAAIAVAREIVPQRHRAIMSMFMVGVPALTAVEFLQRGLGDLGPSSVVIFGVMTIPIWLTSRLITHAIDSKKPLLTR